MRRPPAPLPASSKARLGKALVWRTLDDGRPIYARRLSAQEVAHRIARCHTPYHQALKRLLDAAHARFGRVVHINCHSMNSVGGVAGRRRRRSRRAPTSCSAIATAAPATPR